MPVFVNFFSLRALRVSFDSSAASSLQGLRNIGLVAAGVGQRSPARSSQGSAVCGFWSHFQTYTAGVGRNRV